jgi:hypothetical protein
MLLGTPKSFTCRSVRSETVGDLGGHYVRGRGARIYRGRVNAFHGPRLRWKVAGGDSPVRPL